MRKLEQKIGRLPTSNEMAAALDMSEEDYEHLLSQIKPATFVCLDSVRSAEQEGEATQHEAVMTAPLSVTFLGRRGSQGRPSKTTCA